MVQREEQEEEEVYETHDAPRGPKTPPRGTRPGLLMEAVQQVRLEAAARESVVDGLPTFALPVLTGSAAEAIDRGALSFLLQQQLAPRIEEEEQQVDKHVPESVE